MASASAQSEKLFQQRGLQVELESARRDVALKEKTLSRKEPPPYRSADVRQNTIPPDRLTRERDFQSELGRERVSDRRGGDVARANRHRGRRKLPSKRRIKQMVKEQANEAMRTQLGRMRLMAGYAWLRTNWLWLIPSFGHTVYLLNLTFLIRSGSVLAKKWIPEMGSEWIPGSALLTHSLAGARTAGSKRAKKIEKKISATRAATIKVFQSIEAVVLVLVTFMVFIIDLFFFVVIVSMLVVGASLYNLIN